MSKFSAWAASSVFGLNIFGYGCLLVSAMWVFGWYLDSKPPLKVTGYVVTPAYPGKTMFAVVDVERDTSRNCRANYSRKFIDSTRTSYPLVANTPVTAADIKQNEADTPGKLMIAAIVPQDSPTGESKIVQSILYYCNPWHSVLNNPIEVRIELRALVLGRE